MKNNKRVLRDNVYILLDKSIWKPIRVNVRHPEPSKRQNKTESMSEQNRVNEVDCKVKATIKETHIRDRYWSFYGRD